MAKTQIVSYSELDTFRQCPFKHELAYKERWSRPPVEGSPLSRGSLMHSVLEAHYREIQRQQENRRKGNNIRPITAPDPYAILRGSPQTDEQELVEWIVRGYIEHYGADPDWEIVAVEYANEFWLPTPRGGRSPYKLKIKIDLVIKINGQIWIVDHKSCKDLPYDKALEFDDQFGLYTWGLRKLGKPVVGSIHNALRTLRYKDPTKAQPLDQRFKRTMLYRTDAELDNIAVEAYKSARRAWGQTKLGEAERTTNPDTCRYRCDYTEDCLGSRKGVSLLGLLEAHGFEQNRERH